MAMEKTFNPAEAEARIAALWDQAHAFRAGANAKPGAEPFCILLPPPNVTGFLHVGHAFNHTLMDILIRWKRMQGFDTLWQAGLDHAGIATQLVVERQLAEAGNQSRRELGREAFVQKIWDWKATSGGTIQEQDRRLGASMDWSRSAFTMDPQFHDAVIRVFVDMYNKGLIYRGKRLVNWDPHFETAISDLEVENVEVAGHMWHFKYPLAGGATYRYVEKDQDGVVVIDEERDYIAIATTRPETMLGDGAVAVHPSDERYAPIVGMLCEIPVGPKAERRLIPIITDDYPDPAFGSGAVKITGAHDFNDYGVAMRNNIPLYPLMDTKGAMRADDAEENKVPLKYRGLDRYDARKAVVADITAEELAVTRLVKSIDPETNSEHLERVPYVEDKPIMQPFGDRSKVVIEPMLTDQWFVDTAKIVGPALDAVREGRTKIMPESGEKTYYHWLENIEPWCISRQLWWGHQIPVWYGPNYNLETNGKPVVSVSEIQTPSGPQISLFERFWGPSESDILTVAQTYAALKTKNHHIRVEIRSKEEVEEFIKSLTGKETPVDVYPIYRDPDVLDTWFSSGLWPIGTLGWPEQTETLKKYFPTDVLITGSDILFFWVARMMMMQMAVLTDRPMEERAPFHTVYLHQLVRDEKGEKMSKTRGNVIDPLEIIDEFGADALRFTNAQMAAIGGVLKLSVDRIKGFRNFGTKLWNAHRFAEMNGVFEGVASSSIPQPTQTVNKWIIGEVGRVREEVDAALTAYRFNDAANALYAFVWGKVCDWYVEFSKPLLLDGDAETKQETQAVMRWVLDQCLILLHPIMPFITEDLWGANGARTKLLVHADWPTYGADLVDPDAESEMRWAISMIEGIRSVRAQMNVPAGLYVPVLQLDSDAAARTAWTNNETLIKRLARIDSLTETSDVPKGAITVPTQGATFALPLADIIDVGAEKARITKALEKLGKEMGGLKGRLNNPNFAASAPPEVVAEAQANLALRQEEEAQLRRALTRLAEIG